MDDDLLARLRRCDTPTVCNAIEWVQGKRGFAGFTRATPLCSAPGEGPMVGYARTARLAAREPSDEPAETLQHRRMAYYRHMADGDVPRVAVVADADYPDCVGAYWGEINATVHKGLGLAGALTDGVMRDLDDVPDGFPILAGSVGPSHGFVHILSVAEPVSVFGLAVAPGDLVHADRHGAVVVPPDCIDRLGWGIERVVATERIIIDAARQDDFDFAKFEAAWAAFEAARKG